MSKHFFRAAVMLGAIVFAGAGCATRPAPSETSPVPSRASRSFAPVASSNCNHPYYPLRQGYEVIFKDTSSSPVDGTPHVARHTVRVIESSGDAATIATSFETSHVEVKQRLRCVNGSIQPTEYVDVNAAARGGLSFRIETLNTSGEYLPRDLGVGSTWNNSFQIVMHPEGNTPLRADISATVAMRHRAMAEETVTVPAGTYQALKVVTETTTTIGGTGPATGRGITVTSTGWWVRGVGLVKSVASIGGAVRDTVTEAERVIVP